MNPFNIVFVLVITVFLATGIFAVVAPSMSVSLPAAPSLPTIEPVATGDWLASAGSILVYIGQMVWFFFSYVAYMVSITGVMFSIATLGILPPMVGTFIGVGLMILLLGSILMYVRGNSGDASK